VNDEGEIENPDAADQADEPHEGMEEDAQLGARLGLALVAGAGLLLGAATGGSMWACYPPARGVWWPVPLIVTASVVLLGSLFVTLRRRVGRQAADWVVLGYVGGIVLLAGVVMGDEAVQFVRDHVASSIGLPLSALPLPPARG
jgi:hypothetical protein